MEPDEARQSLLVAMVPGLLALRWTRRGAAPWQQARWFARLVARRIIERDHLTLTTDALDRFPGGADALVAALVRDVADPAIEAWLDLLEDEAIQ